MGESRARELIKSALVWDNHGCMPLRWDDDAFLPQLERYAASGVDVAVLNVGFGEQSVEEHVRMLGHFRRWIRLHNDRFAIVSTPADIGAARAQGKLAVAFNIEGANAVADQVSLVSLYYDLGVRWMLIAYNKNNRAGGGCHDEDGGLTAFGRALVDEMQRVGMVVCCTHTGQKTVMDVMAYAHTPVIFSHSNPRAMHDHPRNITDEAIRACAATGGVVGLNGVGIFLGNNDNSPETFVRHIDYVVQLVGPQHAGIGLDYVFDQAELDHFVTKMASTFPPGMGYASGIRMLAPESIEPVVDELMKLGYGDADIRAILGENFMRVARTVWKSPRGDAVRDLASGLQA